MKNMKEAQEIIKRANKEMDKWDMKDKLAFLFKYTELVEMADAIMAEYDGRADRLNQVMDSLRGGEDE